MDIKFSVIIPAFNASNFIQRTLDSVKAQTYSNYEIIIVNDGSTDNTGELVKEYMQRNPKLDIHYIWQENGGVSAARYRCGLEAKGDYLAFLDADDRWYSNKLSKVVEEIHNTNADVIYHDFVEVSINGQKKTIHCRTVNEEDPVSDLILNGNALATSGTCVCMRLYKMINPFASKQSAYEDYECWIQYAAMGGKFVHIKECLSEYVRNENSLTLVNDKYIIDSYNNSLTFLKYLDKSKYSTKEMSRIKDTIKKNCDYTLARSYHKQGNYKMAIQKYYDIFRRGNFDIKMICAFIFAVMRIRI